MLYLEAIILSIIGGIIYTIIGIIPGTDETAVMAPVTLILVLMGLPAEVLLAWFVALIVAMQISHTIPTAMAALPGSTMAVPMIENTLIAKKLGIPHVAMRKLATGSLIGSFTGLYVAIAFALLFAPLGTKLTPYIGLIFTIGSVVVAYMSKAKFGAIFALLPFAYLLQGIQKIAVEAVGHTLFISIFMGITIGPMIAEIFMVMIPAEREKQRRDKMNEIWLAPEPKSALARFPNPFKILTKKQNKAVAFYSSIGACTFAFSPVGMTVMLGEFAKGKGGKKEIYEKITTSLAVQDSVSNSTYLGEFIIPLIAFAGIPISPVSQGPAAPLFNAPPRFSVEPLNNLASLLNIPDYLIFGLIGIIGGALFAYPVAIKKARSWTELMFRKISHEALIGSFVGLICMLAFYEAGIFGIVVALTLGLFGGLLHNLFNIHTGVQFMAYYASGWLVAQTLALAKILI